MTTATIIDGKAVAAKLRSDIASQVETLKSSGTNPGLAVILVGDDPASHVYVASRVDENASEDEIRTIIDGLNKNPDVHGILLQLPLPKHLAGVQESLVQSITPEKDVDGLTVSNAGKMFLGMDNGLVPCTPQGSLRLIKTVREDLTGLNAVVIGRSNLFGKPMAQLLLAENCTVTIAHSRTKNLADVCKQADILVAAVGRAEMVKEDWVKPGAIVIDVGINRMDDGKLKGDVDFAGASKVAAAISPVPGGVGPMTIACLLANTLKAAQR
jgi:methylenetetrahydrofolate dehydrogenase (NADP+)/methenyltetrahydrofolate cyclohydrolase